MGAHSASGGRRRSGVHREGPAPEGSRRRGRHAAAGPADPAVTVSAVTVPAAPAVTESLAATVETLAADAVAEQNQIVDALLAAPPERPAPVLDEVIELPPRINRRRKPVQTVARALRWTVAGTLIPGLAHLAAGRRRVGLVLAGSFATLLLAVAVVVLAVPRTRLVELSVQPTELELMIALFSALGLIWVLVVLSSWSVHRPEQLRSGQRVLATGVVAALSIGVAAPFAVGARTAYVQLDLLNTIFDNPTTPTTQLAMPAPPVKQPPSPPGFGPATGFFADEPRVNVLLLGGDGGDNRIGVRTDTMILASIDTVTGRTVLTSLPRNLMKVQFPPGTEMARRFPHGFNDMLNAVYLYASNDRSVMPGAKYPGGELLKQTFAWTVGQPVDYFVLVNLDGFRDIVDAFGGVTINVERRLPIGGSHDANGRVLEQPHNYLEPGRRKLNGYEALWYGRSRFDSDDYARMNRQRCLLGAIARQASPLNVLTNFAELAGTAKRIILTDIPRQALPDLLELAGKAKKARVTSLTFVRSAAFDPANPDFAYIQEQVRLAIAEATRTRGALGAAPATTAATPAAPSAAPAITPAATPKAGKAKKARAKAPTPTPTPATPVSTADSLDKVCGY